MRFVFLSILFSFASNFFSQTPITELIKADSLFQQEKLKESLVFYEKALQKYPKNEDVLRSAGYAYLTDGDYEKGEKYYLKALEVNPKCARCYVNLGKVYWAQNLLNRAGNFFDKAVSLDENDAFAYGTRGKYFEFIGNKMKALPDFNKAVELAPENAEYYLFRAEFNQNSGYAVLALGDINKAIELDPALYYPYFLRGNIYIDRKMPKEALEDLNKAISMDSTHAKPYIDRGVAYSMLGDGASSIRDINKSLSLDSTIYNAYYNRSIQKYEMHDLDGACIDRKKSIEVLSKYNPDAERKQIIQNEIECFCDTTLSTYLFQRGLSKFLAKRYEEAIPIYTKNLQKFPSSSLTYKSRGDCYAEINELEKALEDFKSCIAHKEELENDINTSMCYFNYPETEKKKTVDTYLSSAYFSMAMVNGKLKHDFDAVENVDKAMENAEAFPYEFKAGMYNFRCELEMQARLYEKAEKDVEASIATDPLFARAYVNRAILKLNKSDQLEMRYKSVKGENADFFVTNWALPQKVRIKKTDPNWLAGLEDCNKAISIDKNLGYAYYVKAYIEKCTGLGNSCENFRKAKELGEEVEEVFLKNCK